MKRVYRIHVCSGAPQLQCWPPGKEAEVLKEFDGTDKAPLSPNQPFVGKLNRRPDSPRHFCNPGVGALAIPSDAWAQDVDTLFYCCCMGSELLSVSTELGGFHVVNLTSFYPAVGLADWNDRPPCFVSRFHCSILRIEGQPKTDLFCVSGFGDGDEFKAAYEKYGFQGLLFEEIWSEGN